MLRLADSLSMNLRLDFTSRGGSLRPDDDKPTGPLTFRLAGLLGYSVVDKRWFGVSLLGGFGVGAHIEREIAGHDIARLSVDAVGGVQLALTPWRFVTVDVLADQGLTKLVDNARARGLTVSVGLGNTF